MKVPPFVRKTSGLRRRSFVNGKHGPAKPTYKASSKNSVSSDDTDPVKPHDYATPSEVSTNSESSSGNQEEEIKVDWATATMAAESGPEPVKKKRTRSFQNIFRGRRTFTPKVDKRREFSIIDSPIQSPKPVHLSYDPSVTSESTFGGSQSSVSNVALDVHSRSVKKLAPPNVDTHYSWEEHGVADDLSVDSFSNPFSNLDPYSESNPFDNIDHYSSLLGTESEEASEKDAKSTKSTKSTFSIPLSSFLRQTSSWGMSAITTDPAFEDGSKIVMQEKHWGKEVRSRSRDSTSWIPTEEERYKIAQAFIYGEEEARDDESTASATTGATTEVTEDTGIVSEATGEYTNDTTSAYTGYSGNESSTTENSISTTKSYVTTATGDVSMFSLDVDESSKSSAERRRRNRKKSRKRHLIKSDRNILVEVFSDLRLLAEDLAKDSQGCQSCCLGGCA